MQQFLAERLRAESDSEPFARDDVDGDDLDRLDAERRSPRPKNTSGTTPQFPDVGGSHFGVSSLKAWSKQQETRLPDVDERFGSKVDSVVPDKAGSAIANLRSDVGSGEVLVPTEGHELTEWSPATGVISTMRSAVDAFSLKVERLELDLAKKEVKRDREIAANNVRRATLCHCVRLFAHRVLMVLQSRAFLLWQRQTLLKRGRWRTACDLLGRIASTVAAKRVLLTWHIRARNLTLERQERFIQVEYALQQLNTIVTFAQERLTRRYVRAEMQNHKCIVFFAGSSDYAFCTISQAATQLFQPVAPRSAERVAQTRSPRVCSKNSSFSRVVNQHKAKNWAPALSSNNPRMDAWPTSRCLATMARVRVLG